MLDSVSIMSATYSAALELARKELASKKADLYRLQAEVSRLQHTVMALAALVGSAEEIDPAAGITECVKAALRIHTPAGLYPVTVRIKLEEAGFPFQDQKNPMATIHSILKRLEDQGIAKRGVVNGKTAYFWVSDKPTKGRQTLANLPGGDIPF